MILIAAAVSVGVSITVVRPVAKVAATPQGVVLLDAGRPPPYTIIREGNQITYVF
jgi:hypothetical protein